MSLLQASREALRTVKKHTIGYTAVQNKVLSATDNWPLNAPPFVPLSHKFEIAQLSWDDNHFDGIVGILKQRLVGNKWRRVVKALMILNYCLQEGSGRFTVWCKVNSALLTSLETYDYTPENGRDCGIDVRREARKIFDLLHDPTFLDMRSHAEGEHISQQASLHRQQEAAEQQRQRQPLYRSITTSLRRRGALIGFRNFDRSDMTAASGSTNASSGSGRTLVDTTPVTVRQKVKTAISDSLELNAAMDDIRDIAKQTTCPADFLDIMEAILESLVSDDNNRHWGQVLRSIVLLRQCLSNVSTDVAQYFKGNEEVMRLLYGVQELGDEDLLGRTANALRNSFVGPTERSRLGDAQPRPHQTSNPEKPPLVDPPAYAVLNPDEESSDASVPSEPAPSRPARRSVRPLPIPPTPVDWSRLYTDAAGEKARLSLSEESDAEEVPRPLPPTPGAASEEVEELPTYAMALEDEPVDEALSSVASATYSPVTTLVDLEEVDDDDIEYVDEVVVDQPLQLNEEESVEIETPEEEMIAVVSRDNDGTEDEIRILPPPSNILEDVLDEVAASSTRPSISIITASPPPSEQPSPSTSPLSTPPVQCLTGLIRRCPELVFARGGYSDVWRGKLRSPLPDSPEEDVAIKVLRAVRIRSDACPLSRMHARMARETSIWSTLAHAHIVPLLGYALDADGTPAIVSKWMHGGNVLSYLVRHPFADRRRLVRQVADGLAYLHSRSPPVVHGDLKGGNVLVDRMGDAALCDFGMATGGMGLVQQVFGDGVRVNNTMSSTSNAAVGTLRWCAPELLVSDLPVKTLATDVWAFASLALEILTGRLPFYNCTNDIKVIQYIAMGQTPAREDYPELSPDNRFWEVLEACWKQDPAERPMMEELRPLIFDDEMFSALES